MSKNNLSVVGKRILFCSLLAAYCLVSLACRYDMQDQPRYKYYRQSEFFRDNEMSMRPLVEGTVPRGYLREDKALYTGKKEGATISQQTISSEGIRNPATGGQNNATSGTTAATGATAGNAAYPDAVTEFPLPVTKELLDRGEERYRVFCIVCHGPNGEGDGMVVRRGYTRPPSYYDERLRNAPVGHFYDVITNGFGRMSSYAHQIPVQDRWAIVAYIRALQATNPNLTPQTAPTPATTQRTQAQLNSQKNGGEN